MTFDEAVEFVGAKEGGFTSNPDDRGNWTGGRIGSGILKGTKYGISAMSYPDLDIRSLTWQQAKSIYKTDFWDKYSVESLPESIRLFFFDSSINHGVGGAIKILQDAAGVAVDGNMGPKTMAAAKKVTPWDFARARSDYFIEASKKGNNIAFLKEWLRRNLFVLQKSIT